MKVFKFNQYINESFRVLKDDTKLQRSKLFNILDGNIKVGQIILSDDEYDHLNIKEDLGSDNIIYLSYITIDKEYRGKKYFKRTLDWLVNNSIGKYDFIVIRIDTDSDVSFHDLKEIYTKYGFKPFTPFDIDEYSHEFDYIKGEDNFMYYKLSF